MYIYIYTYLCVYIGPIGFGSRLVLRTPSELQCLDPKQISAPKLWPSCCKHQGRLRYATGTDLPSANE